MSFNILEIKAFKFFAGHVCFLCVLSVRRRHKQGEKYVNTNHYVRLFLLQIPVLVHYLFFSRPTASFISIWDSGRHKEKKKINAIQTCYYSPNFDPLIQSMLWLPRHSLSGWHVFHAWNEQFWPLTARLGHRLDTWNRLTGMHSSVFVVWPIESFVSGGGRLVFTAALNINVRESAQNKTKERERERVSVTFILGPVHKAKLWQARKSGLFMLPLVMSLWNQRPLCCCFRVIPPPLCHALVWWNC